MIYNLVSKLNNMLEDNRKVEYRKDKLYVYGVITYLVDPESDEYGKIYIDGDGFNTYSFCMHNSDGQRNVICHYLKEAEVMELFYKAIHKDLELYNY
jgi:hypothetical protein